MTTTALMKTIMLRYWDLLMALMDNLFNICFIGVLRSNDRSCFQLFVQKSMSKESYPLFKLTVLDPFLANVPILYPLKSSEMG